METGAGQYYDKIAHLYDIMYGPQEGFDHQAQVAWVDAWRQKLDLPRTVLDLACGTGQHLACFEALGYRCYGIDASRAMLDIAAGRLEGACLELGRFHTFQLPERVPLVTCFFNALSYNRDLGELRGTLENVHANLAHAGLFVFDLFCTPSPRPVFAVRQFEGGGLRFSRTFVGIPTAAGFESTMVYVVFDGTSPYVIEETTVRGIFTEEEIRQVLAACGFTVLYQGSGYAAVGSVFVAQRGTVP